MKRILQVVDTAGDQRFLSIDRIIEVAPAEYVSKDDRTIVESTIWLEERGSCEVNGTPEQWTKIIWPDAEIRVAQPEKSP